MVEEFEYKLIRMNSTFDEKGKLSSEKKNIVNHAAYIVCGQSQMDGNYHFFYQGINMNSEIKIKDQQFV